MDLEGKSVTVIGLAKSGQAAARLAREKGAVVRVMDIRAEHFFSEEILCWIREEGICAEFGSCSGDLITGSDLVIVSPGVRFDAEPARAARAANIPVIGELEFAFRFCPCPVVAVTGSSGKTTVTTLIGRVLETSGRRIFVGGNIGTPFADGVQLLRPEDIAVLEVSSFQLETIDAFHPHVAVFLNVTQNHLDRHADMQEYIGAKKRIFKNQTSEDFAVLNAADPVAAALAGQVASTVVWFNTAQDQQGSFGANPNFLAVRAAASVLDVSPDICRRVFESFQGIEHRLEQFCERKGVVFINDSKSTTAESGRWALDRMDRPVVWICGGRDKGLDFLPLRETAQRRVKRIIAIGEAASKIEGVFADILPVECFTDFTEAVRAAARMAQPGDAVLLSPMCTSFDMFENFEERGRAFKKIVGEL